MAALSAEQMDVSPTPCAPETPLPSGPRDMHYFLSHGLEGVGYQKYRDTRSFTSAIESQADELFSGNLNSGQYAVFSLVTQTKLATIDRIRNSRLKGLRFLYLQDEETLIVKITPGPVHEVASQEFAYLIKKKAARMGLESALGLMGATTYQGIGSQKQADCALKPWLPRPRKTDWPTLVIECGL
ncbi:hypothetical protein L873DRAFT_1794861 [Choiromyces venosus 120613-1]|uniref:Uncharacterized protein n=1 Tax=Choiromyces venosus 120613-1 TaxID=1336337 RepID=A0A3N4IZ70_9PEZI|nr:hypothetical protein L873DRAFT_1794861 [Choiromyces venosus 120613-1]